MYRGVGPLGAAAGSFDFAFHTLGTTAFSLAVVWLTVGVATFSLAVVWLTLGTATSVCGSISVSGSGYRRMVLRSIAC